MIDPGRLRRTMEEMARVGATPGGGVHRLTLSDADREARDLFATWCKEAGLAVAVDDMGNMFARRPGAEASDPPAMLGSHLDSVPFGGRFDGALGVLAALEVARSLNDRGILTRRPIEVVNWTNEEGPRFPPAMLGSGVFCGKYGRDWAYARRDGEGKRFGEELERIGYRGPVPCRPRPLGGYLELHIEQGPVLESEGVQVGAVEGIVGIVWLRVTMKGERDHAGPTPMSMRRDALVGAARAIAAIREIPGKLHPDMVATVGEMSVSPNAINVIPDRAAFSVDFRHSDEGLMRRAREMVMETVEDAARGEKLEVSVEEVGGSTALPFHPEAVGAVAGACREAGYTFRRMWSAAGHDARYTAELGPAAMIFIPCTGGKSHTEIEDASWEDAARGCDVLARALITLAGRAG